MQHKMYIFSPDFGFVKYLKRLRDGVVTPLLELSEDPSIDVCETFCGLDSVLLRT